MANKSKIVPVPVLRRMPTYLSFVKTLQKQGEKHVSSTRIAEYMGIDATQVTKDLSHTAISGKTRVGYEVDSFVEVLERFLGFNEVSNAFLVGAGSLGSALLQDKGLRNFGLNILKAFDVDPAKVGTRVNDVEILHLDRFRGMPAACDVAIGVVTRRKTYARTGYVCQKDAPAELHACACALLELIQDMPVIKTVLLKPEDICAKLTDAPPEKLLRLSTLCLAALRQTLSACQTELGDID